VRFFKFVSKKRSIQSQNAWISAGSRDEMDLERFRLICAVTLQKGLSYIDIGAHKGRYLNEVLNYTSIPTDDLYPFEANPNLAQELRKNFKNVQQMAISNFEGFADFNICNYDGLSGLSERKSGAPPGSTFEKATVQVSKLDSFKFDKKVGLIKIDVEGAEYEVMLGALNTIKTHKPLVFIEHGPTDEKYTEIEESKELFGLINDIGYEIYTIDGTFVENLERWLVIYKFAPIWNYLLKPKRIV